MIRITAACPAALVDDANHLAMCLAASESDGQTYRGLNWTDADGNLYAAASFMARPEWVLAAQAPLQRPAWDVGIERTAYNELGEPDGTYTIYVIDMVAAERAQAALVYVRMTEGQAAQWRGTPGVTILAEALYGPDAADEIYDAIWSDPAALALYRAVYDPQPVVGEDGSVTVAPERFGVMA